DQPVAYIWARRVRCEGPDCGIEFPLMTAPWLARRSAKHVWLVFHAALSSSELGYDIRSNIAAPQPTPPGTTKLGSATCPRCGYTTPKKAVYAQLKKKRGGARSAQLLAIVRSSDTTRRSYSKPTDADYHQISEAQK